MTNITDSDSATTIIIDDRPFKMFVIELLKKKVAFEMFGKEQAQKVCKLYLDFYELKKQIRTPEYVFNLVDAYNHFFNKQSHTKDSFTIYRNLPISVLTIIKTVGGGTEVKELEGLHHILENEKKYQMQIMLNINRFYDDQPVESIKYESVVVTQTQISERYNQKDKGYDVQPESENLNQKDMKNMVEENENSQHESRQHELSGILLIF